MATQEEQLAQVTSTLRTAHGELLKLEREGFDKAVRNNPAIIGEYLIKLRLNCNLLFAFQNKYLDLLSEAQRVLQKNVREFTKLNWPRRKAPT